MYSYSHMPFVRLVFSLMAGIVFSTFIFSHEFGFLLSLILSSSIFVVIQKRLKNDLSSRDVFSSGLLLFFSVFLLGAFMSSHYRQLERVDHFSRHKSASYFLIEIKNVPVEKSKSFKTIVHVISKTDSTSTWKNCSGTLLLYTQKDDKLKNLEVGDQFIIPNKITAVTGPSNPGEFNYKRYLSFKHIHHQSYLRIGEYDIIRKSETSIYNIALRIRKLMHQTLEDYGLKDDNLAVASALLLGEKGLLDQETQQAYASAGAMHVLAVSGLHVGIIYLIFNGLLSFLFRGDKFKKFRTISILVILWFYAFVTGLSPSVIRAATMFSAISIGAMMNSKQNIYNTLSSSAFILLIIKPNFLFEVGFQLSYLAVVGIVYLQPKIYRWFVFENFFLDKIWGLTAVSFSAQIATFPLGILYFHIFPTYFFLSNLFVIPAAVFIMYLGIALFVTSIYEPLATWISIELIGIIDALNVFVTWIEKLPRAVISNIHYSIADTWLLYIIIITTTFFFVKKKMRFLFLSLTSILLIATLGTYDLINFKNHNYICVYHISKNSALNIISKKYNFMLDVGKLDVNLKQNPFQMKNNWIRHGNGEAEKIKIIDLPTKDFIVLDSNIFGISGKTIVVINKKQSHTYNKPLEVDYLILVKHKNFSMEKILMNYLPKQLIFDSSFSKYYANKYKLQIPLEILVHSTTLDGGFEQRINL